jgi:hypothetical protein
MVADTFTKQAEKFKQTLSAKKLMAILFCDRKGVLTLEETTMTSELYCEALKTA